MAGRSRVTEQDGTSEVVRLAQRAAEVTPSVETIAHEIGEQNLIGDPNGKWEVRAVDKDGAPDPKRAALLKEMFQPRFRAEEKMAATRKPVEVPERRIPTGRITMTGGWLPNAKDREREAAGQ